jgi:hypothetical protein
MELLGGTQGESLNNAFFWERAHEVANAPNQLPACDVESLLLGKPVSRRGRPPWSVAALR